MLQLYYSYVTLPICMFNFRILQVYKCLDFN